MVDTPTWLFKHSPPSAEDVQQKIWASGFQPLNDRPPSRSSSVFNADDDDDAAHPFLSDTETSAGNVSHARNQKDDAYTSPLSLATVLFRPPRDVRKPMLIVCCAMIGQQISGINAILYYSNKILARALPDLGPYVSLGITVVNVAMTFPPIFFIEKLGRRQLLVLSTVGALVSHIIVGVSLDAQWVYLASGGIITFVM